VCTAGLTFYVRKCIGRQPLLGIAVFLNVIRIEYQTLDKRLVVCRVIGGGYTRDGG
jgi:hypothetical protein